MITNNDPFVLKVLEISLENTMLSLRSREVLDENVKTVVDIM